jgi:hypothetical protein
MIHPLRVLLIRRLKKHATLSLVDAGALDNAIEAALAGAPASAPWIDWLTDPAKFLALVRVILEIIALFSEDGPQE